MRRPKRFLVGVGAASALAIALTMPALAHGQLPSAACNEGTTTAHSSLGPNAQGHDHIPHSHDGGVTCVHRVPH